jgi:hypothetical protein
MTRALLLLTLAGCGVPDPKKEPGAPKSPPDDQYFVDMQSHVARVLVWDCTGGHRIVMTNECGMICQKRWNVLESACGSKNHWDDIPVSDRKPIPPGTGW